MCKSVLHISVECDYTTWVATKLYSIWNSLGRELLYSKNLFATSAKLKLWFKVKNRFSKPL